MSAAEMPVLQRVWCPGAASRSSDKALSQGVTSGHAMAYWEWNATGRPDHPHVVVCVHGLSRQGRDFDTLARDLARNARVICPDVVGRGQSDWLEDPTAYQVPVYAADMLALLWHVHAQAPIHTLDWVGTSMGGLIGLALAGSPELPLPTPIRRLVLNDVGPVLEPAALQRIGTYLGKPARFDTSEQGAAHLAAISTGFGPHSEEQWMALSRPMLRAVGSDAKDEWQLHYDPAIAEPFKAMTDAVARDGEAALWSLYDQVQAKTLVLRGVQSDLLTAATASKMAARGPHAAVIEFAGVGHAPTLIESTQRAAVIRFLTDAIG